MKTWIVDDLAIPLPRAEELFQMFDYDTLVENRSGDISDMLGAEFVLNSPIYKAMGRELDALKMLNLAVEQEPLKGTLAKACEDAKKEEGNAQMQEKLMAKFTAKRTKEKVANDAREEEVKAGEEKIEAAEAEAAAAEVASAAEQHQRKVEEKAEEVAAHSGEYMYQVVPEQTCTT